MSAKGFDAAISSLVSHIADRLSDDLPLNQKPEHYVDLYGKKKAG